MPGRRWIIAAFAVLAMVGLAMIEFEPRGHGPVVAFIGFVGLLIAVAVKPR